MPMRFLRSVRNGWLAAALLVGLTCGCNSDARDRVIVLGLDGMEPTVVDLLVSEGRLPNFARLRQEGAYGKLISSKPILSPIIWTTIATGRNPADHRIGHFVAVNEKTGEQLPVTSQMRGVKALWNVFTDANKKVGVVGWWATWPAETVNGAVVSDHTCYHFLFDGGAGAAVDSTGITYPPELHERLTPLIRRPASVSHRELSRFVHVDEAEAARPFRFEDDLAHFKWAYATGETYRAIGRRLWEEQKPELLMVYIEGTDSTSHLFGHLFRAKGLQGELAEQQRRYGNAVEEMYVYADGIVGEFLELMDDDTTLIVLSDHGFQLGALPDDPSKTRDMRRVSEKFHNLEGILYAYGKHVKARAGFDQPVLLDIAPTILAVAGLSPARDMPGRVLYEGFDIPRREREVASYEDGKSAVASAPGGDAAVDPAILERLRALGYLDIESPTGDRNLAALLFQEGRYEEAAKAYRELVAANPEDGAARASLAGVLGAMGAYDEALRQLDEATRLAPLNPEGYHNRAVILEKKGARERAVAQYQEALRYAPDYEPSLRALTRLGVDPARRPASEADRKALALAEEASVAARRGDYTGAMKLLDEAERLAPELALVHQYRANVAFLMGDKERARAALRRALEIEPDNALYRTNLEKLG